MKDEGQFKSAQMDLLYELHRICQKHAIRYFLDAGTLIGAIRHDGFIPWDDDIDVGMLRQDYDRFIEACKEELDPAYTLYDWHKDPYSPLPFLKLKINGTHYREEISAGSKMNDGIFIDIFPYDNAPDAPAARKKQAWKLFWIRKILLLRCGFRLDGGSIAKKLIYGTLNLVSRVRSVAAWKKSCDRILIQYRDADTTYVTNMCSAYKYEKMTFPREMLREQILHRFETGMFCVPEQYDAALRQVYGNYMQLPPEEQRAGRHGVLHMDLGSYRIRAMQEN